MNTKHLLRFFTLGAFLFTSAISYSQAPKIGVFDLDIMVRAMPGYATVDSLVASYDRDSLGAEYDYTVAEYNRLDSTYKADSAAKKSPTVLNLEKDQRTQFATTIIYWQQISQNKSGERRRMLADPLFTKVIAGYKKVLDANNYLVILKPGAYEVGSKVDNVFERVAKELKINLPDQLRSAPEPPSQQAPQAGKKAGAKTPAKKQ